MIKILSLKHNHCGHSALVAGRCRLNRVTIALAVQAWGQLSNLLDARRGDLKPLQQGNISQLWIRCHTFVLCTCLLLQTPS